MNGLFHSAKVKQFDKTLLKPLNISPEELAEAIKVPHEQIRWVYEERADITPDLALRLSIYFDSTTDFWLNLQKSYEKEITERKIELLRKEIQPYKKTQETKARLNH